MRSIYLFGIYLVFFRLLAILLGVAKDHQKNLSVVLRTADAIVVQLGHA